MRTSDVLGAGTDANVYVKLFGELGDSGDVHLRQSVTNKSPFQNNQTDVFNVRVLELGDLQKCVVWHDNKGFLFAIYHFDPILNSIDFCWTVIRICLLQDSELRGT